MADISDYLINKILYENDEIDKEKFDKYAKVENGTGQTIEQ